MLLLTEVVGTSDYKTAFEGTESQTMQHSLLAFLSIISVHSHASTVTP